MNLEKESTEKLLQWRDDFRASSQTRKAIEAELASRDVQKHPDTGTLSLFSNETLAEIYDQTPIRNMQVMYRRHR